MGAFLRLFPCWTKQNETESARESERERDRPRARERKRERERERERETPLTRERKKINLLNPVPEHDCPTLFVLHRTKCKPMHSG